MNHYILTSQNLVARYHSAENAFRTRQTQERQEFQTLGQSYSAITNNNGTDMLGCSHQTDLLMIQGTIDNCLNRLAEVVKNMEELALGDTNESDDDN